MGDDLLSQFLKGGIGKLRGPLGGGGGIDLKPQFGRASQRRALGGA